MELSLAEQEIIRALRRVRWGVVRVTVKAGRPVDLCEEKRTDLTKLPLDIPAQKCYTQDS